MTLLKSVLAASALEPIIKKLKKETLKDEFVETWMSHDYSLDEAKRRAGIPYAEEVAEEDEKDLSIDCIQDMFATFRGEFEKFAKLEHGMLKAYRCITVDTKKFINAIKAGKQLKGYKGLGVYYSWKHGEAEAHWSGSGDPVYVTVLIPLDGIDIESMAENLMQPSTGPDEYEVTVKPGTKIYIKEILDEDDNVLYRPEEDLLAVASVITASSLDSLVEKLKKETLKDEFVDNWSGQDNVEDELIYRNDLDTQHEFSEEDLKEYSIASIAEMFSEFESEFNEHASLESGMLVAYRCMTVDPPKFIKALKAGKSMKGFKGLGIYYSWKEEAAESHWTSGKGEDVYVKVLIPLNGINIEQMAQSLMALSTGPEECEVTLKPGTKVQIVEVLDKQDKVLFKPEDKLLAVASFEEKGRKS